MPPRLDLVVRVGRQTRRRPPGLVTIRPIRRHPVRRRPPIRNVGARGRGGRRRCGRRVATRTRLDILLFAASYSGWEDSHGVICRSGRRQGRFSDDGST
ncbi:uncharacterized protein EAF01_010610 [Botrytis porri]|uniref:uncharacterized protein n=1 Tax=Botrytis porri TaxID=87229 RepID=UPI0019029E5C|nr:uncharacterized protein EAF01_010610 [Botrytis porri]KAF7890801.1 hypothetical protein EAF01_010610 [Botrytis porri]